MIIYSSILDRRSDTFLIKYLQKNKWLWDYKIFFDGLTKKQSLILMKALISNREKLIFACFEGQLWSKKYWRPFPLAKVIFAHFRQPNAIFYNYFFDLAINRSKTFNFRDKGDADLIDKVCFISSNVGKIEGLQQKYRSMYSEIDIYGSFHSPTPKVNNEENFVVDAINTCAKYMAALCVENNDEEGYFQGSALDALHAMTPPILKAAPKWKNFIREEFVIDFFDYQSMNKQERLNAISKVQDRLFSGDTFLTTLSQDYIEFFKESFAPDVEPDFDLIIKESQVFRSKFTNLSSR
jgi:hypothetical protein